MTDLESFRAETRAWLEANCPPEMREPMRDEKRRLLGRAQLRPSRTTRRSSGWTRWPSAAGPCPTGRRTMAAAACRRPRPRSSRQEMARIGARKPLISFGISMLGPALLKYGSEEQKKRFLPEIARGEIRWCQGYSEPGAGSDLAGAPDQVRGQGRPLAGQRPEGLDQLCRQGRLDLLPGPHLTETPKHEGISFLLFDMETPGRFDQADPADLAAIRPSARPSSTT